MSDILADRETPVYQQTEKVASVQQRLLVYVSTDRQATDIPQTADMLTERHKVAILLKRQMANILKERICNRKRHSYQTHV